MNRVLSNLVFELKDYASPDVLENGRGACFFEFLWIFDELVFLFVHEEDRATADPVRCRVEKDIPLGYEQS